MNTNFEAAEILIDNAMDALEEYGCTPNDLEEAYQGIACIQAICHHLASKSGWWKTPNGDDINPNDSYVFGTKVALIHSEISEALEGKRKNRQDDHLPHRKSVEVELADALIRIFDTAGAMGLDIAGAVMEKLAYNQARADHKISNRAAAGGKEF